MFGFLNGAVLFAAAAALIPLIIHLFSRRRVRVVEFSSLRHLKEMQRRQLRRLKIRQWLLLLLRTLIILAVVFAFARPTLKQGSLGSHASVSAIILFDNSVSMDRAVADGNLFEIARRRAGQLAATFGPADEVALLPLARPGSDRPSVFGSAAVVAEQLNRLERAGGRADLQAGLAAAERLMQSAGNLNRELFLVTDRQRSSLPEEGGAADALTGRYLLNLPLQVNDDLGVVSIDLGGQLLHPGHDFELVATVRNYGREVRKDRIASLFINGRRTAQTDFEVGAGEETTVRFTPVVTRTGFHSGWVELSDDRFASDNRRYFSFRIPDKFSVLMINGDPATGFLAMALNPPNTEQQYWSVKEAAPDQLAGVNFNDYDVVMLIGAPALESSHLARLQSFVRRGRALLVTYGGATDIATFNRNLSEMTAVVYEQPVRDQFTRSGYYSMEAFDLDHPIFAPFNFENHSLPELKFYTLPEMHVEGDGKVLVNFTGGRPALVETGFGRGRVMTFTGPMSPEYSDLVSHSFFVPLVARLAEYLAADLSGLDVNLHAGTSISRSLSLPGSGITAVELVMPDSSFVSLPPEEDQGVLIARTPLLKQAGIYRIVHRGREIDRFAVNYDPTECDLAAVDVDQMATALGFDELRVIEYGEPIAETVAEFRLGRELWAVFLWIAAVLLALEMWLGRKTVAEE